MKHPRQILQQYQLEPKKSLGQNFLADTNLLARLTTTADLTPQDHVLEIGPGLGSLTHHLAQTAAHVTAVELDDRFLPILQNELAPYDNVQLIHGDILAQNLAHLCQQAYKVIANVPYYITGAILRHLLSASHKPTLIVMTVQKEVAQRLTAVPPKMTRLAVSVQFYGTAHLIQTIKAGAFWPRPDVDSAIVRIDVAKQAAISPAEEKAFFRIVKAGFSQKRKQLKNNLGHLGYTKSEIAAAFAHIGLDGRRRAETLTLPEWTAVYRALSHP